MITKPKRQWSKTKDYLRKKTFRALRRKGKRLLQSFDEGTDDNMSYFDWATKASRYKGIPIEPNQRDFDYYGWYNTPIVPYRGTYGQYAFLEDSPNAHFNDFNKGVYHPTFNTDSKYSGRYDLQFNPFAYKGGTWINDHKYIEPQYSPISTDRRIDYLNMAENNGVQLRAYGDQPIWFDDGSRFDGVLPEVVVRAHNSGKDIHINKANRGKFTSAAKAHNMGVQEFANKVLSAPEGTYSPTLRKRANFARNFAH